MKLCSIENCGRPVRARELCTTHWARWRKYGDPMKVARIVPVGESTEEKILYMVDKTENCWIWKGAPNAQGYGVLKIGNDTIRAHRIAYELWVGPIPDGLVIDHICGVRNCCNPSHLQAVSRKENNEHKTVLDRRNKSGYQGVYWDEENGMWRVQVQHNGKKYPGGRFHDVKEANEVAIAMRNRMHTNNLSDRKTS